MIRVACIVEGDGEVTALPVLLRRLTDRLAPGHWIDIPPPIRVRRDRFLNRPEEFSRILQLAALKAGEDGRVLILLDADDACPAQLGRDLQHRASTGIPHRPVSVVLANREYEAWFLAACASLDGQRGLHIPPDPPRQPENIRGAKEWLGRHMHGGRYREVTDQPALSQRMDLQQAFDGSRSFRKLCSEWQRICNAGLG